MLEKEEQANYIELLYLPTARIGNQYCFIAAELTERLQSYLCYKYGQDYRITPVPKRKIMRYLQLFYSDILHEKAKTDLLKSYPEYSAYGLIKTKHLYSVAIFAAITLGLFLIFPRHLSKAVMGLAQIMFMTNIIFRTVFLWFGQKSKYEYTPQTLLNNAELPVYSILLPLYKEDYAILSLINSIYEQDYPIEKLDIKIIVEQYDRKTLSFLKNIPLHPSFELVCVPYDSLKTKPKACNYALNFARGKYVAIYDAEDQLANNQLRIAATLFAQHPELACLQAKLNFYNYKENLLTHFFAVEYFLHFTTFILALAKLKFAIPLGGSSNHFRASVLKQNAGWDPYNVTEDAEIGLRMHNMGYKIGLFDSLTLEEAPIRISSWINQRSRWMKGHLQTSLVYIKNFRSNIQQTSVKVFLGGVAFLLLPIICYLLQTLIATLCFIYFISDAAYPLGRISYYLCLANIISWHISSYYTIYLYYKKLPERSYDWKLIFFPYYVILFPIAAIKGCWQLLFKPYYWHKTTHDYYKRHKKFIVSFLQLKTKPSSRLLLRARRLIGKVKRRVKL